MERHGTTMNDCFLAPQMFSASGFGKPWLLSGSRASSQKRVQEAICQDQHRGLLSGLAGTLWFYRGIFHQGCDIEFIWIYHNLSILISFESLRYVLIPVDSIETVHVFMTCQWNNMEWLFLAPQMFSASGFWQAVASVRFQSQQPKARPRSHLPRPAKRLGLRVGWGNN